MPTIAIGADGAARPCCWPARSVLKDARHPIENSVCATMWPIRSLNSQQGWFDELHLWTEGFEASMSQRARIQSFALEHAFRILAQRDSGQIAVTLSFGTVERHLDHLAGVLEASAPDAHRLVVILRGAVERARSRYRLRAFVEYLRILQVPVGYLLINPRMSKEVKALGLLQPDFAKIAAPKLARIEPWQDLALEARVAGGPFERLIVAQIETAEQVLLAKQVGIPFGQGSAVAPSYAPPLHDGAGAPAPAAEEPREGPDAAGGPAQAGHAEPPVEQLDLEVLWNGLEAGTQDAGEDKGP
jgi:hypothetical protein